MFASPVTLPVLILAAQPIAILPEPLLIHDPALPNVTLPEPEELPFCAPDSLPIETFSLPEAYPLPAHFPIATLHPRVLKHQVAHSPMDLLH